MKWNKKASLLPRVCGLPAKLLVLETRDIAAQLRLNEKFILMMEKNSYSSDLPPTFIRGYLRSYAKFVQISELEVKKALEPLQPKTPVQIDTPATVPSIWLTGSQYFMQVSTYLIITTLVALVGTWWYKHSHAPEISSSEHQLTAMIESLDTHVAQAPVAPGTNSAASLPLPVGPLVNHAPVTSSLDTTKSNTVMAENKVITPKKPLPVEEQTEDFVEEGNYNNE